MSDFSEAERAYADHLSSLELKDCTCGISAPDRFGNRDLLVSRDCPIHADGPDAEEGNG